MAPKRGGGGGGRSSGGSSSVRNKCADYNAFADWYSQGTIAVWAIHLVLYLLLADHASRVMKRNKQSQIPNKALRWYGWGLAMFLIISYYIVTIVYLVISECGVIFPGGEEATAFGVSLTTMHIVAEFMILGVVIFSLVPNLLRQSGRVVSKLVTFGLAIPYSLAATFMAAWLIVTGLYTYDIADSRYRAGGALETAYYFIYLLCVIAGSFAMIASLLSLRSNQGAKSLLVAIPFLAFTLFFLTLNNIVGAILFDVLRTGARTLVGIFSYTVIWNFALFLVFLAVFLVGNALNRIEAPPVYDPLARHMADSSNDASQNEAKMAQVEQSNVAVPQVHPPPVYAAGYQSVPQHQVSHFVPVPQQTAYTGAGGWTQAPAVYQQPIVYAPPPPLAQQPVAH